MFIPNWTYDGTDPGLQLFTLANAKLPDPSPFSVRSFVYEIGACDTDWIERVRKLQPSWYVTGIDWRAPGDRKRIVDCGDVLTVPLPYAHAFIAISAIEHVGLGHYDGDPRDDFGDIKAVQRLRDRVHDGGFIYLDVPYSPEGYWVKGSKCRIYDDRALRARFGPHRVLGYTRPDVIEWISRPEHNHEDEERPYYYVALMIGAGTQ